MNTYKADHLVHANTAAAWLVSGEQLHFHHFQAANCSTCKAIILRRTVGEGVHNIGRHRFLI